MNDEDKKIKGSLFFLYIGKLKELGLIEGGAGDLTMKGFDIAIDAYNSGHRLSDEEISNFLEAAPGMDDDDTIEAAFGMIAKMQEIGFDGMKELVERVKKTL